MDVIFAFRGFIQEKMKAGLVITTLMMLFSCNQKENWSARPNKTLDNIESLMFQYPESLDSLIAKIDTINTTEHEQARIKTIEGLYHYNKGEFSKCIKELERAELIFSSEKDEYHINITRLVKAFTFEYLNLDTNAANIYVDCENYFEGDNYVQYKFYATLGLLRLSNPLTLNKEDLIKDLKRDIKQLKNPIYDGLLYASMANIEKHDSIKIHFYEKAKVEFVKSKRWGRVYSSELNMLFAKIRLDHSENAQKYYDNFPSKEYKYTPTIFQSMRYNYGQAYLFSKQWKNIDAIKVANCVLNEAIKENITEIEIDCSKLLSGLYLRIGEYKKAAIMILKVDALKEKNMEILQQNRLLALGAHYRYSELENEKLGLKVKVQRYLLILSFACLLFSLIVSIVWLLLKASLHRQEILKLKNIEIAEQISKLLYSLNNEESKNHELISQVESLKYKYKDSVEVSKFLKEIDQKQIITWIEFETSFLNIRPGWLENLKREVPDLTPIDLKYCMCLYFNLNNSHISNLCHVSIDAIKSAKKRIRDKFSLTDAKEIYIYLKRFDK